MGATRKWLGRFVLAAALASGAPAWGQDAGASREDRLSLQRRLTDAGCYAGAIDGAPSAALDAAAKACPDQRPVLRIETGMHTASIGQIGVDANCARLATSSVDKTARVWSLPDGRLERTIRPPIGAGNGGKIYAAALSPDGSALATGGWDAGDAQAISVTNLASGAIARFGAFEHSVNAIAYSPDGRRIAVGLGGGEGLRVLDAASGAELAADRDYGDGVSGLAFAADGSLITASLDGSARRYGPDLRRALARATPGGGRPSGVAIDPAGRRIAIGYVDNSRVSILDAVSLAPVANADAKGSGADSLGRVAWSSDGATLAAGARANALFGGERRNFIRRFTRDGRRIGQDTPVSANSIFDIRRCGDGFVFAATDPAFGWLGADGKAKTLQASRAADMRDKLGAAFELSDDATAVRFGLGRGEQNPVTFDLGTASLVDGAAPERRVRASSISGLPVSDWENNLSPRLRGEPIALETYERSRSLAIRPDQRGFALGTAYRARAFDASGQPLWDRPGPSEAWGVNFSADGEILAVAYGDGTIRWHRWSDGEELLSLFVEAPTRKWVAWTPSGYFMASPGGEDLIGWHVNRGWAQLADFFPASRFSARFNRPDIVRLVLETRDEAKAIERADVAAHRKTSPKPVEAQLPPVTQILSPAPGAKFSTQTVDVSYVVRSPSGLPIDGVQALIDGRPVETRGVAVATPDGTRSLSIPAPPHDFELALIARSGELVGEPARARFVYAGAPSADPASILKPKLYAVAIGVGAYADENLRLTFPAADARGVAEALARQKGGLYSEVEVRVLVDGQAKRADVLDALDWLGRAVTSRDIGIVLIAGHGVTDEKGDYWFLPADAAPAHLSATAISQSDIRRELDAIAGKAVLFLDTCHANSAVATRGLAPKGVDVASVVNDFAKTENGVVVFASSQGSELAREDAAWGHGAFSLALIDGLEGKADVLHTGEITISGLDLYIADRVKALTEGHQHPVMSRPNTIPDFAFALAR
jgi:WD40 repeat protein